MLRKMLRRGFLRGRMAAMKTSVRRKLSIEGRIWEEQKPEECTCLAQEVMAPIWLSRKTRELAR
jgi:hypothetical protein